MAEDWAAYFKNYRHDLEAAKLDKIENLRPHTITRKARVVAPAEIMSVSLQTGKVLQQSGMGKVYGAAHAAGWEIKCGISTYFSGDKLQVNGKLILGSEENHVWLEAVKTPHHFTMSIGNAVLNNQHVTTEELLDFIKGNK